MNYEIISINLNDIIRNVKDVTASLSKEKIDIYNKGYIDNIFSLMDIIDSVNNINEEIEYQIEKESKSDSIK